MKVDEEKEVNVSPDEGYGDYNNDFLLTVPLKEMQGNFNPEPGMVISVQMENGQLIPARITAVQGEDVLLDLNHPLAGKNLHFKVKVLAINDEAQLDSGCSSCSSDSCSDDNCCC
jgi:FKBP-type peptidyl-prolyl cis-trans isomerase SlyD